MRIMKVLNCRVIIIGVLTVAIVAYAYLPREISGENTIGGWPKCSSEVIRKCDSLKGKACTHIRHVCYGSGPDKCDTQSEEPSDCSEDQFKCKNQPDESCY
jgi:hypothetical protein